jgi:hypothetical protein
MEAIINEALKNGIWVALSVFLIFYNMKANEKQERIQTTREERYMKIIDELTAKLLIINDIQKDIIALRGAIENSRKK